MALIDCGLGLGAKPVIAMSLSSPTNQSVQLKDSRVSVVHSIVGTAILSSTCRLG